jgi:hypothetical protein
VLFHDICAPASSFVDWDANMHYYGHEVEGSRKITEIAKRFALSNKESNYLQTFILNHNQIAHLAQFPDMILQRYTYRYFKKTGEVGIDICLFSLMELITRKAPSLSKELVDANLQTVLSLFSFYWDRELMDQATILNGEQVMRILHVQPGEIVGKALEMLKEEQAIGEVKTPLEGEKMIKKWYQKWKKNFQGFEEK